MYARVRGMISHNLPRHRPRRAPTQAHGAITQHDAWRPEIAPHSLARLRQNDLGAKPDQFRTLPAHCHPATFTHGDRWRRVSGYPCHVRPPPWWHPRSTALRSRSACHRRPECSRMISNLSCRRASSLFLQSGAQEAVSVSSAYTWRGGAAAGT